MGSNRIKRLFYQSFPKFQFRKIKEIINYLISFIFSVFLKFNLAISFSLSNPYLSTIFLPVSSTKLLAPLGSSIPTLLDSLSNSLINIYLLIKEAHATDKCLSSPLVKKVIFLTTLGLSFK